MNVGYYYREMSFHDYKRNLRSAGEIALEDFLKRMRLIGHILSKSQAIIFRKKYINDNLKGIYRDDLVLFEKHMSMPIEKFMKDVCSYEKSLQDSKYQIKHNPFREGNIIYGIPSKKCNISKCKFV